MSAIGRYKVGPPQKPAISHDNGFLALGKRTATVKDKIGYIGWHAVTAVAEGFQHVPFAPKNDISDALAAYRHFLVGGGAKRVISIERYVASDSSGKKWLKSCMKDAQWAVFELLEKLPQDKTSFQFYSEALTNGLNNADFPYPDTENWQKTIGGFSFWITGSANIERNANSTTYNADVEVHIEDMYNFNPNQKDIATGIPDDWNGGFAQTGLAKQYINYGSIKRSISWTGRPSHASEPKV